MTDAQRRQFQSLACALSPENLACDGELRGRALATKAKRLRGEWSKLEKAVGRRVSEDEVW